MTDKKHPTSHEELIELLDTDHWEMPAENTDENSKGTLRNLTQLAHDRQKAGQVPGTISHIESAIELDLIQLQKLWEYLGLPV